MIDSMNDLSIDEAPSESIVNNSLTSIAPVSSSSSSSSSSSTAEKKKKTNKIGWSKGFLNSTTQRKRKPTNTTSDEIKYEVDITSKDKSIIVQATSSDTLQSIDNNNNTASIVKTNDDVKVVDDDEVGIVVVDKSEEEKVAPKKNIAFTGHIFERMTP